MKCLLVKREKKKQKVNMVSSVSSSVNVSSSVKSSVSSSVNIPSSSKSYVTTSDLIFVCSLVNIHENMTRMNSLKQFILLRKNESFIFLDCLLIYYYFIFTLQTEKYIQFVDLYMKKFHEASK